MVYYRYTWWHSQLDSDVTAANSIILNYCYDINLLGQMHFICPL